MKKKIYDGKKYSARFSLLYWKKNVFVLKFQMENIYHFIFFFRKQAANSAK